MWLKSLFATLLLLFLSCDAINTGESDLLSHVPDHASVIVKINNLSTFQSELKNNHFLNDLKNTSSSQKIVQSFKILSEIQADTTSLIALFEKDTTHFLFVGYARPNWLNLSDSTKFNTSFIDGVQNIEIDGMNLYAQVLDGKRIASSSRELLEEATAGRRMRNSDDPLNQLYRTSSPQKSASIYINTEVGSDIIPRFLHQDSDKPEFQFSDWITFDLNSGQQYLYLNGLARSRDTTHNMLSLFEGTRALPATTPDLAPPNSDALLIYTFDDYERFAQNQQQYLDTPYSINTAFKAVEEIGLIYRNGLKAIVLSAYASEEIATYLNSVSGDRTDYQGNDIVSLSKTQFLNEAFDPLIKGFKASYYSVLDDKYIFSESPAILESIITGRNGGINYRNSSSYEIAAENLTNRSNILLLANSNGMKDAGEQFFPETLIRDIEKSPGSNYIYSSQIASDNNFFHTHLSVNKLVSRSKSGTASPLFTIELDNEISSDPQFVVNHRTGKKEIVVQDAENNLYLISTEGKVLWKKELEGPVQGEIRQVDIYKNGRLQLAFTTNNQFLILDRNGKEVPPFNKSYPGGNLNPLAVFDYENNKDYRFVVTQGSKVFMYNSRANIVSGFKYTEAKNDIMGTPKHIRIGQRDYLVFKLVDGSLKIISRVGSDRITVNESIEFSDNEVYLYRNKFILTDKSGTLFSIDTDGKVSKSNLNFNEDHRIDATSKTLATLNENTISIKGRSRNLDLGVYLRPEIFYVYDKIYVSTTDIQNAQVYLFDSSNRPIPGFPVYGNSVADLADMDNDGRLELVTRDKENSLIVYAFR